MAKYQQYEEYKNSGVEWLGEIPSSWRTGSLRWMIDIASGESLPSNCEKEYSKENQFPVVGGNGVMGFSNKVNTADAAIAVGRVGALCGNIHSIDYDSWITDNALKISKWNKFSKDFLVYLLKTANLNDLASKTAQPLITGEQVKSLKVVLLPIAEQTQIANFLDFETTQIDTLIEKQQTLIQLLKEKRQAVISHAVTKGLNPDAPMKDSGVEWLGEVPEHWDIVKLKWKASTTSGGTPTTSKYEDYYEDGDIPWIRTTDLNNDKLNETPIMITPKAVRDSACSLLPKNSVLIAMYGGAGSIGKHSLLRFESTINQAVCGVLPSEAFVPDYLHRFYEFYRPFWMIGAAGTRKDPNIGQDNIKEARIPIPPLNEQHQIADYLDKMQNHFDALTDNAERAIQLMQERRTALISAAVTGKIDVRGWEKDQ